MAEILIARESGTVYINGLIPTWKQLIGSTQGSTEILLKNPFFRELSTCLSDSGE